MVTEHGQVSTRVEPRRLRADAQLNRERILTSAREVFAGEGYAAEIDAIAQRAGVGVGTVYRHFPTKDALFVAVVADLFAPILQEARDLAERPDGEEAFFALFTRMTAACAAQRPLGEALIAAHAPVEEWLQSSVGELFQILGELLLRAQRQGTVRRDVQVTDLHALMRGCQAMEQGQPTSSGGSVLSNIVIDGLRTKVHDGR